MRLQQLIGAAILVTWLSTLLDRKLFTVLCSYNRDRGDLRSARTHPRADQLKDDLLCSRRFSGSLQVRVQWQVVHTQAPFLERYEFDFVILKIDFFALFYSALKSVYLVGGYAFLCRRRGKSRSDPRGPCKKKIEKLSPYQHQTYRPRDICREHQPIPRTFYPAACQMPKRSIIHGSVGHSLDLPSRRTANVNRLATPLLLHSHAFPQTDKPQLVHTIPSKATALVSCTSRIADLMRTNSLPPRLR